MVEIDTYDWVRLTDKGQAEVEAIDRWLGLAPMTKKAAERPMKVLLVYGEHLVLAFGQRPWVVETGLVTLYSRPVLRVDDRAKLVADLDCSEKVAPGWRGAKHILVQGKVGTVVEVGPDHYLWCPDDQTWIDMQGAKQPVHRPLHYYIKHKDLEAVS